MKFSTVLWKSCSNEIKALEQQQFTVELSNGTLSTERFMYYIEQDVLYLNDYAKALALLAGRSDLRNEIELLLDFARTALIVEQAVVHEYYSENTHIQQKDISPACLGYTSYLLRLCALAPIEVAVAGILPCPWIYVHIGKECMKEIVPNNPYQRWIDTYANDDAVISLDAYITLLDTMAERATDATKIAMQEAFKKGILYEYYFWEDAYSFAKFSL